MLMSAPGAVHPSRPRSLPGGGTSTRRAACPPLRRRARLAPPPAAAAAPPSVQLLTPSCEPALTRRAVETLGEAFREDPLLPALDIRPSRRSEFFK
jgi:hypothetical protein